MRGAASLVDLGARVTHEHHRALKVWLRLLACTVKLTPAGRELFARMATVHEQWMIELPGGLHGAEKMQICRLLAKPEAALAEPADDLNLKRRT